MFRQITCLDYSDIVILLVIASGKDRDFKKVKNFGREPRQVLSLNNMHVLNNAGSALVTCYEYVCVSE